MTAKRTTKSTRTRRRSKREQIAQKRRKADQAPPPQMQVPEPGSPELPEMPPSPIAQWLLDPTPETWARLQVASSLGRITKADVQTAMMAQLQIEVEHFNRDPDGFEPARKAYVNRQRLLRSMLDVAKQNVANGPLQEVRIVWPTHYDPQDPGEDVRLEVPDE